MLRVIEFRAEERSNGKRVDWVLIAPVGDSFDKTQSWHRVAKVRPPEDVSEQVLQSASYKDMAARWSVVGPAYEAWLSGNEMPEDGTPLGAWSGVTPEQAAALRSMGVRTVEEVTKLGDSALGKLKFPNARKLPGMAKSWLEGTVSAEKDSKIAQMEEEMAAMRELLEERLKAEAENKRGPGRPRKTEAA